MESKTLPALSCREVTKEEISHFQTHGWVKLEQLVTPETVSCLREILVAERGESGDRGAPARGKALPFFLIDDLVDGYRDERLYPLHKALGHNARALHDRGTDVGMRFWASSFLTKLPARNSELAGTGATNFHQDYPDWKLDRSGGMAVWLALGDYGPESGTMSFLNGSKQKGSLGAALSWISKGLEVTDLYPKLAAEYPSSGPVTYKAGDATVHADLTVHGAGQNLTDMPRSSYTAIYVPADSCWTGAPAIARYNKSVEQGLKPGDVLDDANFPLVD
ncbi:MAG TPA: phytanoyl-CoA dioxygenase family protein [Allosphingosinicella sp.]|nr:phytanoyl-CoA dioxygenase family protein [Allosphingosinicella sp.]